LVTLSRVVDTLWRLADASERWRAHAVVQDVLSRLGLGWLGLLDGDPRTIMKMIDDIDDRQRLTESIVEIVCRAIDEGSSALGLDVDRALEYKALAVSLPKVLLARQEEVKSMRIRTGTKNANLHPLWVTDFGFRILSSLGLGTKCSVDQLKQVRNLLSGLGVQLNVGARKATRGGTVTGPMSDYIWKLADLRAKMKKRKRR